MITTFGTGGAETSLRSLVPSLEKLGFSNHVAVVSGAPDAEYPFPVTYLGAQRGRIPSFGALARLRGVTRQVKPDLVQGWMYHGNLFASLAGKLARATVAWNIRHSLYDIREEAALTQKVILANKWLSNRVAVIVNNSRKSVSQHEAYGFAAGKQQCIPNGFDCDRFSPIPNAKSRLCRELGIDENATLVGMVARYHPIKGHLNLIQAIRNVAVQKPDTFFVLAGRGVRRDNDSLTPVIRHEGLENRCILLDERSDTPLLHSAFDIEVLPSLSEGFPNVVGEAMACQTPCVVTDVGDAAYLVGTTGRVVPPNDPDSLAEGIVGLLDDPELVRLGRAARSRIETEFSLPHVTRRYAELYGSLVHRS